MGDHRGIAPMCMTGNLAENWKTWRDRFENYLVAAEINKKSEATQCAQLLHYIGEEGFKIYRTFTFEDTEKNKITKLIEKFEAHFLPKENLSYERFKFFSYKQQSGQTLEQYITELKNRALKCKLEGLQDSLIKTMITCGVNNSKMREELLQQDDLTLEKAIEKCLIIEMTKERSESMDKINGKEVDAVKWSKSKSVGSNVGSSSKGSSSKQNQFANNQSNTNQGYVKNINNCTKCGRSHMMNKCPAFGKSCNICKGKNHFANKCFKKSDYNSNNMKKVHDIDYDDNKDSDDYLFVGSIDINDINTDVWMHELNINRKNVMFKLDSGSYVNILPIKVYEKIKLPNEYIKESNAQLSSYSGNSLRVLDKCNLKCINNTRNLQTPLLGLKSLIELNLIKKIDNIDSINSIETDYSQFIKENKKIFTGIGCIKKRII